MSPDDASSAQTEEDAMAAEWAAALAQAKPEAAMQVQTEQVAPVSFANFPPNGAIAAGNDINMILDIPVQLTVELGRTRIPIKHTCNWRRARWWNWKPWPANRWTCWSTAT